MAPAKQVCNYTIARLLEMILLIGIKSDVSGCGLLHDELFGFRTEHSTFLQLAGLLVRMTRNFVEKRQRFS